MRLFLCLHRQSAVCERTAQHGPSWEAKSGLRSVPATSQKGRFIVPCSDATTLS